MYKELFSRIIFHKIASKNYLLLHNLLPAALGSYSILASKNYLPPHNLQPKNSAQHLNIKEKSQHITSSIR